MAMVVEGDELPSRDIDCVILTVRDEDEVRKAQHITTQRRGQERHNFALLSSPDFERALQIAHEKADALGITTVFIWKKPESIP
jgi:hypothetical protein